MNENDFVFTELMIEEALIFNGYFRINDDQWVKPTTRSPDASGISMHDAFRHLLKTKNII